MPLPIIVAGVLARYGAKKLAKHLVKQSIKKSKGMVLIDYENVKSTLDLML